MLYEEIPDGDGVPGDDDNGPVKMETKRSPVYYL
jgi:hypothetical protein